MKLQADRGERARGQGLATAAFAFYAKPSTHCALNWRDFTMSVDTLDARRALLVAIARAQWGSVRELTRDAAPGDLEAATFTLVALRKSGRAEAERTFAREVSPVLVLEGRRDLALAFAIEAAASTMNQGDYRGALHRLDGLADTLFPSPEEGHPSDALLDAPIFWRWRAAIVRGLCEQALGRYAAAEKALALQAALLVGLPIVDLATGLHRRRLSLLIESERYNEANAFHSAMALPSEGARAPLTRILWHVESLRLSLAAHDSAAARASLAQAEALVAQYELPRTFVNLVMERAEIEACEILSSAAHADVAQTSDFLARLLCAGEHNVSLDSDCTLRLMQAEILRHAGRQQEALLQLEVALAVAEKGRYGRLRVRLLIALWSLRDALGFDGEAQDTARALSRDPVVPTLPLHAACAAIVTLCAGQTERPLATLCSAFESNLPFATLHAWICRYGLEEALARRFSLRTLSKQTVGLPTIFSPRVHALVVSREQRECARAERGRLVPLFETTSNSTFHAATFLVAFLEKPRHELTAQQLLHILNPGAKYTTARDAERVRAAMSRLRKRLALEGLAASITYNAVRASYTLTPGWGETFFWQDGPVSAFQADARRGRPAQAVTPREAEVAAVACDLGTFRFADIHARFPVRRQSLHVFLARLVEKGLLVHERRGRASRYIWTG